MGDGVNLNTNHINVLLKTVMVKKQDEIWCSLKLEPQQPNGMYGMYRMPQIREFMATMERESENYIQQQVLMTYYKQMPDALPFRQRVGILKNKLIELWLWGTYICSVHGCVEAENRRNTYIIDVKMRNGATEQWLLEYDEDGDTFTPWSVIYKKNEGSEVDILNGVEMQKFLKSKQLDMGQLLARMQSLSSAQYEM